MQAILFDLDGTLLDIDTDAFLRRYFAALGPVIAEVLRTDETDGLSAVLKATNAMMESHPGVTNRDIFADRFAQETGLSLEQQHWEIFDRFYAEVFPGLQDDIGPRRGGRESVETARAHGLKVVLATNPIFPEAAIRERMRWAGVDDIPFDLVTSYETMTACKPLPEYFRAVADAIDVPPAKCMMVGDDAHLDMPAADIGMHTFYVGAEPTPASDWAGNMCDVADVIPRLLADSTD